MTEDTPIKAVRVQSDKTQPQVAKELKIDIRSYQRYEYGEVTQIQKSVVIELQER